MLRSTTGRVRLVFGCAALFLWAPQLGCGPANWSDPAFWAPYEGGGGGGGGGATSGTAVSGTSGTSVASGTGGAGGAGGAPSAGGALSFRFTTVSQDGKYAPKNVGAVWITSADDVFVKTLEVWASKRAEHLVRWVDASGTNVVDAITGATRSSHKEHISTWNGTDKTGVEVPDGTYRVHVEFTEWNSSDSGQELGPSTSVDFEKGPTAADMVLPDEPAFIGRQLTWTP